MLDTLKAEAETMQGFLETDYSDNINEMLYRVSTINTYMARSGKMLADARYLQDQAQKIVFNEQWDHISALPASQITKYINAQTYEENYLVNWLDRINRTCVHQSENLRTQISFIKEQLNLERRGY